jgi:drug/metabolite transporter (DMT)-like permease
VTATAPSAAASRTQLWGALLCAASAASFGAMAIFGKLAYEAGIGVLTLLLVRFALAGAILGTAAVARRPRRRLPRGRVLALALGLGAVGYTAQSALYFTALERIDAGLAALVLYTFPALVTLGAVALGRDRLDRVRVAALGVSFGGLVLILSAGIGGGGLDATGVALALGASLAYTAYILTSDSVVSRIDAITLSALVCAGATGALAVAGGVSGALDFSFEPIGWLWLAGIAVVSTVAAIVLFFAGLRRVGPSRASIISTVEPLVTVALAFAVFRERLGATQLLGGALVLAGVVLLQTVGQTSSTRSATESTIRAGR